MIELGKKSPGPTLRKLFEQLEQSPVLPTPVDPAGKLQESFPSSSANPLLAFWSTETLIRNFKEMAEELSQSDQPKQRQVVGILREWLDELERRLLANSTPVPPTCRVP